MSAGKSQKGIILAELLITSIITATIIGGLSAAMYAIISVTQHGNDETSALHDIQNASYWISRDAQMASTTNLVGGAPGVPSVTLGWVDNYGNSHSSSYQLQGTELQRTYDGAIRTVGLYISSIEFSITGNVLTFHTTSTPPGRWQISRASTDKAYLRPGT